MPDFDRCGPATTSRQTGCSLLEHVPLTFPEHSRCYSRSSLGSGGGEDHPDPARRPRTPRPPPFRVTPRDRRAPGRPPPRSGTETHRRQRSRRRRPYPVRRITLSIVPVGAVTPPGGHGPPASGLPAPRHKADSHFERGGICALHRGHLQCIRSLLRSGRPDDPWPPYAKRPCPRGAVKSTQPGSRSPGLRT